MDFDPNATTEERKRSGPRWYSVSAFLVIAFLLLLNAVAMFANAKANSEHACWTRALATAEYYGNEGTQYPKFDNLGRSQVQDRLRVCTSEYILD